MFAGDQLSELKEEFKASRAQFPCLTIITPADRKSVITKKVMPFMLKRVKEVAAKSKFTADRDLANLRPSDKFNKVSRLL